MNRQWLGIVFSRNRQVDCLGGSGSEIQERTEAVGGDWGAVPSDPEEGDGWTARGVRLHGEAVVAFGLGSLVDEWRPLRGEVGADPRGRLG